jgi:phage shock protein C
MISEQHMGHRLGARRRLYRARDGIVLGVCGGLADHFGIDRRVMRLVVALAALMFFPTVLIGYVVLGLLLEKDPDRPPIGARQRGQARRESAADRLERQQQRFRDLDRRLQRLEEYITSSRFKLDREFDELRG